MSRSIDPMAQHKAGCGLSRRTPRPHRFDESAAGYSLAGCSPAEPASASPANLIMPPLGWIRYAFSVNCNPSLISWPRRRGPVQKCPLGDRRESSSSGLWNCGNRVAISKGRWEGWKTTHGSSNPARLPREGFPPFPSDPAFPQPSYEFADRVFRNMGRRQGWFAAGLAPPTTRRCAAGFARGCGTGVAITSCSISRPSNCTCRL